MSREVKLIVFGLILAFAFYNKYNDGGFESSESEPARSTQTREASKINETSNNELFDESRNSKAQPDNTGILNEIGNNPNDPDLYTKSRPRNGHSPYDRYFGKGIYNNSTKNILYVKTPSNRDIVFLLVDYYSKEIIRNEYIRAGSRFDMTGIPYGTYSFKYFAGNDWSDDYPMFNGKFLGGFTDQRTYFKSDKAEDLIEFERGYIQSYELTLYGVQNGNLETETTSEGEFFNKVFF